MSWSYQEIVDLIPNGQQIVEQLKSNLLRTMSERFRYSNKKYIETIERKLVLKEERLSNSCLFIESLLVLMSSVLVVKLFFSDQKRLLDIGSIDFSWVYLISIAFFLLWLLKFNQVKLRSCGVTLENGKPSVIEGIILGLCLGAAALVASMLITHKSWGETIHSLSWRLDQIFYLPNCYLQEFIARGVLLGSLSRILQSKFFAISMSSLFLGLLYLPLGFTGGIGIFLSSLLFGFIYLRHNNLFGVAILHAVLGWILQSR